MDRNLKKSFWHHSNGNDKTNLSLFIEGKIREKFLNCRLHSVEINHFVPCFLKIRYILNFIRHGDRLRQFKNAIIK